MVLSAWRRTRPRPSSGGEQGVWGWAVLLALLAPTPHLYGLTGAVQRVAKCQPGSSCGALGSNPTAVPLALSPSVSSLPLPGYPGWQTSEAAQSRLPLSSVIPS